MIKKILLIVFCICLVFTIPAIAGGHHGGNCHGGGDDGSSGGGDTGGGNDSGSGSVDTGSTDTDSVGGPGDISSQNPDDPCDTYSEFIKNHCTFKGFRAVSNN